MIARKSEERETQAANQCRSRHRRAPCCLLRRGFDRASKRRAGSALRSRCVATERSFPLRPRRGEAVEVRSRCRGGSATRRRLWKGLACQLRGGMGCAFVTLGMDGYDGKWRIRRHRFRRWLEYRTKSRSSVCGGPSVSPSSSRRAPTAVANLLVGPFASTIDRTRHAISDKYPGGDDVGSRTDDPEPRDGIAK